MNYRPQIAALLRQWLHRTREERRAIQTADWAALRQIQSEKAELRSALTDAIEKWRAECPREADLTIFAQDFRRLIELESYNGDLVAARRHKAQQEKLALEQALYNLRRVRSSYVSSAEIAVN